jgi:uncharacterized RDD family membrane protein YckC
MTGTTGEQPTTAVPLASWGERAAGLLIDLGLILAGIIVLGLLGNVSAFFIYLIVVWYFAGYGWFQWIGGTRGQTPGQAVMGLKLVRADSQVPIGGPQALIRWLFAWVLNLCCVGGVLDYLWPLWDERNQTLHDKAVGSTVLTGHPRRRGADLFTAS